MWLRSNPVTPARMFQYLLDAFVITFLKSSAQPIGEVIEYVIRIEFQAGEVLMHTHSSGTRMPKNLDMLMKQMSKHSLISIFRAPYLIMIRSYETW